MKVISSIIKGIFGIVSKLILMLIYFCSLTIAQVAKAIADGVLEHLKSK